MKETKRIEINKKVGDAMFRVSRTGGINVSTSPFKNITLNSKHGVRVSKTFKGLSIGLQNTRSVFRGRWSAGGMNVNLSKTGFSLSSKSQFGTINLVNSKRSSGTLFGLQFRGSKGLMIAGIGAAFYMIIYLVSMLFRLAYYFTIRLIPILLWIIQTVVNVIMLVSAFVVYMVTDLPKQLISALMK